MRDQEVPKHHSMGMKRLDGTAVMVRFGANDEMFNQVKALSEKHGLSLGMTVKMLLGYAFNEIERTGKTFVSKVVFESDDQKEPGDSA